MECLLRRYEVRTAELVQDVFAPSKSKPGKKSVLLKRSRRSESLQLYLRSTTEVCMYPGITESYLTFVSLIPLRQHCVLFPSAKLLDLPDCLA